MSDLTRWEDNYIQLAFHISQWSKDPSTKVGAVLVGKDPRNIALGYNGFPPGILDETQRLQDKKIKYIYTQHAERNVLDNAHFETIGGLLVTTQIPCSDCTKSIISKGITRIIYHKSVSLKEPWLSDAMWSWNMLKEVGIIIKEF